MPATLVVYYSHSGHTKAAAEAIAQHLGADMERIDALGRSPKGLVGFVRAGYSSLRGQTWRVSPATANIAAYNLVVLCAPVWAGRLAPPARAWLESVRGQIRALAACATVGGTSASRFFADVEALVARPILARATITDSDRTSGADARIITRFVADMVRPSGAPAG